MQDLGTLGGDYSIATSINGSGQIAGYSYPAGYYNNYPFLWSNGVMQSLGTLGGQSIVDAYATAINASGQIAGWSWTFDGVTQDAFLWSNGTMRDLGQFDNTCTIATSINSQGLIVGYSDDSDPHYHDYLYFSGTKYDLSTLSGAQVSQPSCIIDNGQIVAVGSPHGALLLTPEYRPPVTPIPIGH